MSLIILLLSSYSLKENPTSAYFEQMGELINMYSRNEQEETEKIINKADKMIFRGQIAITLACLGPIAWLISGFEPAKTQLFAVLSIPTLIFIGYLWTSHFLQKEIIELNREIDELSKEIADLK